MSDNENERDQERTRESERISILHEQFQFRASLLKLSSKQARHTLVFGDNELMTIDNKRERPNE
eukprot:CAMPEP_0173095518 /NCGR_PEP_ID=MMETSP1102-20130122/32003_1 /TAXON_ID=49646 /ORGANISM="Geminigera sp., Strain Caron Lab Isolate" /LENGTH=63 /DNA_ID=CAMNT_0013985479 /DNA_START=47 /DNA_END=235 /DNA_ORIENTATION=-